MVTSTPAIGLESAQFAPGSRQPNPSSRATSWHEQERINSAIPADLWAHNTSVIPDQQYENGEVVATPIDDLLGRKHVRFGYQARRYNEAIAFWDGAGDFYCLKTDKPHDAKGRRYLYPTGLGAKAYRPSYLSIDIAAVANAYGLEPPAPERFWPWVEAHEQIKVLGLEGAKKCLAVLSPLAAQGIVVVGVGGHASVVVHPRDEGGEKDLSSWCLAPGLAELFPEGSKREFILSLDEDTKQDVRKKVSASRCRIGWFLKKQRTPMSVCHWHTSMGKGPDDVLVLHGEEAWLGIVNGRHPWQPPLPKRLVAKPDKLITGRQHFLPSDIPTDQPIVAIQGAMGSGKTEALSAYLSPFIRAGIPVVMPTHRQSLGGTLGERLGLPYGKELQGPTRVLGGVFCVDSFHMQGCIQINSRTWGERYIVVIDEVDQVISHALLSIGTAVAQYRPEVLLNLIQLLQGAEQIIVASATLDQASLDFIESITGGRPYLIANDYQPAAGRALLLVDSEAAAIRQAEQALGNGGRIFISTSGQKADSTWGSTAIGDHLRKAFPHKKVLVVDRETSRRSGSDAAKLATDPAVCLQYDAIVASPSVETGLSIDATIPFDLVVGITQGNVPPESVVQSLGRVRFGCPRILFAKERGQASALKMGNGSFNAADVLSSLNRHATAQLGHLRDLLGGLAITADGPELAPVRNLWAAIAARRNSDCVNYRARIVDMLEREGYVEQAPAEPEEEDEDLGLAEIKADFKAAKVERIERHCQAVATAETITDLQAAKLQKSDRLSEQQQLELEKHTIQQCYPCANVTPELVAAHEAGLHPQLRMLYFLGFNGHGGLEAAKARDAEVTKAMGQGGQVFSPDLCRKTWSVKVQLAMMLDLQSWMQRTDEFRADDLMLQTLEAMAACHRQDICQVLGLDFGPNSRPTTILRQLLDKVGFRLESRETRDRTHNWRGWLYRVVPVDCPLDLEALFTAWGKEVP